jgi:hypothetical protein
MKSLKIQSNSVSMEQVGEKISQGVLLHLIPKLRLPCKTYSALSHTSAAEHTTTTQAELAPITTYLRDMIGRILGGPRQ